MNLKTNSLTPPVIYVVENKGTELPFSGTYTDWEESGSYLCRRCGLALFRSTSKFHSGCGWPSFDEEITNAVLRKPDADGMRIEILCAQCKAHLGHVFQGENFTANNTRHCVNSLSLDFTANREVKQSAEAIFAAGCFWGVESLFKSLPGVLKTEVGYIGGKSENPSYERVCEGNSGHLEALRILYNPGEMSYEALVKYFFEIHDPTQANGQGPDIGEQYLSAIFYYDEKEKALAEQLIHLLEAKGLSIKTKIIPASPFWRAEDYHQDYYQKTGKRPYCHHYQKRF